MSCDKNLKLAWSNLQKEYIEKHGETVVRKEAAERMYSALGKYYILIENNKQFISEKDFYNMFVFKDNQTQINDNLIIDSIKSILSAIDLKNIDKELELRDELVERLIKAGYKTEKEHHINSVDGNSEYDSIDIWIDYENEHIPIELKFRKSIDQPNENHQYSDMYIDDTKRIEKIVSRESDVSVGYAIFVTDICEIHMLIAGKIDSKKNCNYNLNHIGGRNDFYMCVYCYKN